MIENHSETVSPPCESANSDSFGLSGGPIGHARAQSDEPTSLDAATAATPTVRLAHYRQEETRCTLAHSCNPNCASHREFVTVFSHS